MIDKVIDKLNIPGKLIYLSQYGSHLYGLNTENSDLDFRGVYIPNIDDVILHKDKDEINEELEITYQPPQPTSENGMCTLAVYIQPRTVKVDVKIFSLQKFIQLCSKADTNALDLLFSWKCNHVEQYITRTQKHGMNDICNLLVNKDQLINTDRLESPITYAFKQATKYGLKGERLKVLELVKQKAKYLKKNKILAELKTVVVEDLIDHTDLMELEIPNNHLRIDVLDNKGKKEKYLFVCGVQHQFNLDLDKFIKRIEEKITKEYTSQRTIDSKDGNDWKALSHALRVLLEIKELLSYGTINFPLKDSQFLLDVKLGKIDRDTVDRFFEFELSTILENVKENKLGWKYNEMLWDLFILNEYKGRE